MAVSERSLGVPVVRDATAESGIRRVAPCLAGASLGVDPELGVLDLASVTVPLPLSRRREE
jgi:hypothetical protein